MLKIIAESLLLATRLPLAPPRPRAQAPRNPSWDGPADWLR
jgi:hypothetical protein